MLNTNKLLSKFSIVLIIIIGIGLRYLPNLIQLALGIPLFTLLGIYSIKTKENISFKVILMIGAVVGFISLISTVSTKQSVKEVTTFVIFILLAMFLIVPKIIEGKHRSWNKREIFALTFIIIMLILLVL
jgi:hypothetical protein